MCVAVVPIHQSENQKKRISWISASNSTLTLFSTTSKSKNIFVKLRKVSTTFLMPILGMSVKQTEVLVGSSNSTWHLFIAVTIQQTWLTAVAFEALWYLWVCLVQKRVHSYPHFANHVWTAHVFSATFYLYVNVLVFMEYLLRPLLTGGVPRALIGKRSFRARLTHCVMRMIA